MNDPLNFLKSLTRPRLLISAARHVSAQYRRDETLRKLLKTTAPAGPAEAVMRLISLEQGMEEARQTKLAGYSVARHVAVLGALMAEGRSLESRTRKPQVNASATSALRLVI